MLKADSKAFMHGGPLMFSGRGVVVNLGRISSSGAAVFLVSRRAVAHRGSIDAPQGSAELATGQQVLLQDSSSSQQVFVQGGS
jgi:hypothetical protein